MRDVTNIPDALLDVIARAIKIHMAGMVTPLEERVRFIEAREVIGPLVIDHSADLTEVRTQCANVSRDYAESMRELDRAQHTLDELRERITTLEAREVPVPKDGIDGEHGRDAYELDVLPVIDFTRSYPRGTVAQHQGGVWRAFANTQGTHGWTCIVDGINAIAVTRDSERGFTVRITRSSDTTDATSFVMPVLIYRGVYQAGRVYEEGDVVTWGGSLWHCNEPTDAKPDGESNAWTLAAKRGRDGRDLRMIGGDAA